jgi:hypothetical protein
VFIRPAVVQLNDGVAGGSDGRDGSVAREGPTIVATADTAGGATGATAAPMEVEADGQANGSV